MSTHCPRSSLLCFSQQPGHYSSLTAPNLQHTANQERNYQCVVPHHSRELLMMGIVMPETCWASKNYNKIVSGIWLVFYSSVITMMHGPINIRFIWTSLSVWRSSSELRRDIALSLLAFLLVDLCSALASASGVKILSFSINQITCFLAPWCY